MSGGPPSFSITVLTEAIRVAVIALRATASALESALQQVESATAPSQDHPRSVDSASVASHWDLVGEVPPSNEAFETVAASLAPIPQYCLDFCSGLGTESEIKSRAERAWNAGLWAKATAEGKVPTPRPSPKLPHLRNRVYIILRAPGISQPTRVSSAGDFYRLVPNFTDHTLCHAFASIAEARVYCSAFGISLPLEQ